jgi:hypothetical protein
MDAKPFIETLRQYGVNSVLYGSRGVSLYLGAYKQFNDLDLLVEDEWVEARWDELVAIMAIFGYRLVDAHEHEFRNAEGAGVAFAAKSILVRDGIMPSVNDDDFMVINGIRTLSAEAFLRAYKYSVQDGYRVNQRGKKDAETIALLEKNLGA